jgi:transcription elongation factor GreB
MSRAFLKESTLEEPEVRPRGLSALPLGAKNLLTPEGTERLRSELDALAQQRAAVTAKDSDEGKRALQLIDEKLRPLAETLRTAETVSPPTGDRSQVKFGAKVHVRERSGTTSNYRLVGVAEARPEQGEVSYLAPIAQALLNARVGDKVTFRFPRGATELEILSVEY